MRQLGSKHFYLLGSSFVGAYLWLACPVFVFTVAQGVVAAETGAVPVPEYSPVIADELGFEEIVFVKRKPYSSDHYYTDINNGTSPDRFVPENGIYLYNLRTRSEKIVVTAASLPGGKGLIGKISLSFDARKVLFDFRERPEAGFRIWEVGVDGAGLRQVSVPPSDEAEKAARWAPGWHTDDIHPCYLPDGRIIFSSTRSEHTVLCGGSSHLVAPTLHRMDPDGSNVEQLTKSPVSEFCPVVLEDGRVMYHRWEYIDKGARVAKTIWSMLPDGTRPKELFGLAEDTTTVYMYPQPLPGAGHRLVCVGTCHYPQGGCVGMVLLVDYGKGVRVRGPDPDQADYVQCDERYPVLNLTPHVFVQRRIEPGWYFRIADGKYVHDPTGRSGHLYTHPFPVNDRQFLVSYKVNTTDHFQQVPNAYAIYLLDSEGNHRAVHGDSQLSCWHPVPLVTRPVPPALETQRDPKLAANNQAVCVVANVYQGMQGVSPGSVKWLRLNEALPRYWSTGRRWDPSLSSAGWKAALWPRVQWGVVPVEKDGSAYFLAPANRSIFLQALDANFREIQRERTYVNYAPGEMRSCTGCHGQANHTPTPENAPIPMALTRPPSVPQPQPCDRVDNGGDGLAGQVIHYPTDIQPIFDAKCVSCHGADDPAGGLRLTGETTLWYNTSYEQLASKELAGPLISEFTSFSKGDQGNYNGAYLPPLSLGCSKSKLIAMLTEPQHPGERIPKSDPANSGNTAQAGRKQDELAGRYPKETLTSHGEVNRTTPVKNDHTKLLTEMELMVLSRWVDSNYQFYGSYFGRHHSHWANPDPNVPAYRPTDFRRKASFQEATSFLAPAWHR